MDCSDKHTGGSYQQSTNQVGRAKVFKEALSDTISQLRRHSADAERRIEDLQTLFDMLPTNLTPKQDAALFRLVGVTV